MCSRTTNYKVMRLGLFGIYRWLLACTVVAAHLGPIKITHVGYYSVFAFFTLSSYLVTLNLNGKYCKKNGTLAYLLNRIIRVYPLYLVAIIFAFLAIKINPMLTHEIHGYFNLPVTIHEKVSNIILFGYTDFLGNRLNNVFVPPAWSLSVEIYFWCLIPVLLHYERLLKIWSFLSLIITLFLVIIHAPFQLRYYSPLGCSLAFCSGVWLYRLKPFIPRISSIFGMFGIAVLISIYAISHKVDWEQFFHGFYFAFLANLFVIHFLSNLDRNKLPNKLCIIDDFAGNISYAIFLLHIFAGFLIEYFLPGRFIIRSYAYFVASLITTNVLAIIAFYFFEAKIASYFREKKV